MERTTRSRSKTLTRSTKDSSEGEAMKDLKSSSDSLAEESPNKLDNNNNNSNPKKKRSRKEKPQQSPSNGSSQKRNKLASSKGEENNNNSGMALSNSLEIEKKIAAESDESKRPL